MRLATGNTGPTLQDHLRTKEMPVLATNIDLLLIVTDNGINYAVVYTCATSTHTMIGHWPRELVGYNWSMKRCSR